MFCVLCGCVGLKKYSTYIARGCCGGGVECSLCVVGGRNPNIVVDYINYFARHKIPYHSSMWCRSLAEWLYVYVYVCICVRVSVFVCVFVCVCAPMRLVCPYIVRLHLSPWLHICLSSSIGWECSNSAIDRVTLRSQSVFG